MTGKSDEEEDEEVFGGDVAASTRRAYYAGRDVGRAEAGSGLESGGYRGVPSIPHGGSQHVKPEDTAGSMDWCWCGHPFDHDWPGKALGAPHPSKDSSMSTPDSNTAQPRIERRQLRAYHADLVDVILTAVNQYGVKYRITGTKILLFPPDGTTPLTINAANSDRQRRKVQQWFVRHCVPKGTPIKRAASTPKEVDETTIKELAETMNSEEHLGKLDEPAKDKPTPEPAEVPVEVPVEPAPTGEWVPYQVGKNKADKKDHPFYLTNGVVVRCPEHNWEGTPRSLGGHTRTHHTDTQTLWGKEAKEKAIQTFHSGKLGKKVEEAILLLQEAIGVDSQGGDVEALTKERDKLLSGKHVLQTENAALKAEVADLKQQLSDLETKMALAREAFGL